jgi:hypothetical protein
MSVISQSSNSSHNLTSVESCRFDSSSDVLTASFSKSDSTLSTLSIKITGVTGDSGTENCVQSSNPMDTEGCSVLFTIPNTEDNPSGFDQYAMYQPSDVPDSFVYDGSCSISWEKSAALLSGEVNCNGMVQTHRKSSARNPVDSSITADLTGATFECSF